MLNIISSAYWPFVFLLWRNVYLGLPSNFWLDCFFWCWAAWDYLYILEIKPLSAAAFANIFSSSESCLFVLFMISFAVQKGVSLIKSYLLIFVFISIALGDWPEKILVWFMPENVLPNITINSTLSFACCVTLGKNLIFVIVSSFIVRLGLA